MVRPCGARGFVNLADAVLHQCIRPLIGACCAPGHHGYPRASRLTNGKASKGQIGTQSLGCAGQTVRPSLCRADEEGPTWINSEWREPGSLSKTRRRPPPGRPPTAAEVFTSALNPTP